MSSIFVVLTKYPPCPPLYYVVYIADSLKKAWKFAENSDIREKQNLTICKVPPSNEMATIVEKSFIHEHGLITLEK